MKIYVTNVHVDDQAKALEFYTGILGFKKKADVLVGAFRWLTVVDENDGVQLLLEPSDHPATQAFKKAIVADGIPAASFQVDDIAATHAELEAKGVKFLQPPTEAGGFSVAVFDDTCGNLIQIIQMKE